MNDVFPGVNRKIKYSFIDSSKGHFKIASDSGIITLAKPLDREIRAQYNLTIQTTDQGTPRMSTLTSLVVNVQDINDNPPEFASKYYFAVVPEIDAVGTEIVRVLATSKDTGVNADVYYSIIGGNEHKKFAIDNKTGVITIAEMLDYERAKDYFLTIQAVDGGTPPLSNMATVNITVTDCNDNAPVFSQVAYSTRIREDAQIGDKILQVLRLLILVITFVPSAILNSSHQYFSLLFRSQQLIWIVATMENCPTLFCEETIRDNLR